MVREASKRVLGMRHFDVQLLGGMVLNDRCIAECVLVKVKTLTARASLPERAVRQRRSRGNRERLSAQRDAENNRPLSNSRYVRWYQPAACSCPPNEAYAADITTAPTTNTVLTTCATTWRAQPGRARVRSVNRIMRWWMSADLNPDR